MNTNLRFAACTVARVLALLTVGASVAGAQESHSHDDLVGLFADWRAFESPPLLDGAPDYTVEQFEARQPKFEALRARLGAFDIDDWPVSQQVDWHLVRAEMNGYDFNRRVLKPWARDPAFYATTWTYRSDVPAHEGPTHHAVVELWAYDFPLGDAEQKRLVRELAVIPPLFEQAKVNLTGNARDLWVTGIRDIRRQGDVLARLADRIGPNAHAVPCDVSDADAVARAADAIRAMVVRGAPLIGIGAAITAGVLLAARPVEGRKAEVIMRFNFIHWQDLYILDIFCLHTKRWNPPRCSGYQIAGNIHGVADDRAGGGHHSGAVSVQHDITDRIAGDHDRVDRAVDA